jgi:hypothetical protein
LIKLIAIATIVAALALPAAAETQPPIRVNCGGPSYTDSKGQIWSSDTGYVGVASTDSTTKAIQGTADQKLFQS